MPLTIRELANRLAAEGYTRNEYHEALLALGFNSYEADPNTYIEDPAMQPASGAPPGPVQQSAPAPAPAPPPPAPIPHQYTEQFRQATRRPDPDDFGPSAPIGLDPINLQAQPSEDLIPALTTPRMFPEGMPMQERFAEGPAPPEPSWMVQAEPIAPGRPTEWRSEDELFDLEPAVELDPVEVEGLTPEREEQRKQLLVDEFRSKAERKTPISQLRVGPDSPLPMLEAGAGVLAGDFIKEFFEEPKTQVWGTAMKERAKALAEVPVQFAIEGDLRVFAARHPERWNSDRDVMVGNAVPYILSAAERRDLDRMWDQQDAEVIDAWEQSVEDTKEKAELRDWWTNFKGSSSELAHALFEVGVSMVGGNIPLEAWKAKSVEEREEILSKQANDTLRNAFGKDTAVFVGTVLASPLAAAEVHPAPLALLMYRPVMAVGSPASKALFSSVGKLTNKIADVVPPLTLGPLGETSLAGGVSRARRGMAAFDAALRDPAAQPGAAATEAASMIALEGPAAGRAVGARLESASRKIVDDLPEEAPVTARAQPVPPDYTPEMLAQGFRDTPAASVLPEDIISSEALPVDAIQFPPVPPPRQRRRIGEQPVEQPPAAPIYTPEIIDSAVVPDWRLGYRYPQQRVNIDSSTGKITGRSDLERAARKPEPMVFSDDVVDTVRTLDEVFGDTGIVGQGLLTEAELLGEITAAIDTRLANQLISPRGRETATTIITDYIVENSAPMGRNARIKLGGSVKSVLDESAGRTAGATGTAEVFNPIFEFVDAGGKTRTISATEVLYKAQKRDPALRKAVAEDSLANVSKRISVRVEARGIRQGIADQLIESSPYQDIAAYRSADAATRASTLKETMRGDKQLERARELRSQIDEQVEAGVSREKLRPLRDELATVERNVGDLQASYFLDRYLNDSFLPAATQVAPEAILEAFGRLRDQKVKVPWMLNEHFKYMEKVSDPTTSTFLGLTRPDKALAQSYRRVTAEPLKGLTTVPTDVWITRGLNTTTKLMAADAGVAPIFYTMRGLENLVRVTKLGKVAGNPGSHVMAFGSNTLAQVGRRGDPTMALKATNALYDYLRYKGGGEHKVPRQVYEALEQSGRLDSSFIKAEVDRGMLRSLGDGDVSDVVGSFMVLKHGGRIYDMWDQMFKLEDGVNQLQRRVKEWDMVGEGQWYDLPISRTTTKRAYKRSPTKPGMSDMVVDGRQLTVKQRLQLMGRAAMEPGSRIFVDFNNVPLMAVLKRNVPLLDISLADFATWRLVTDTLPFIKQGIAGEIAMGAVPRGATSSPQVMAARIAEQGTVGSMRALAAASASEALDENQLALGYMLNKFDKPHPVFSISYTADERIADVIDGSSFSVYESLERNLRLLETVAKTGTASEWLGYMKPESMVDVPGSDDPVMLMDLTPEEIAAMPEAQRRQIKKNRTFWKEMKMNGGLSFPGVAAYAYMEGNIMVGWLADMLIETRAEKRVPFTEALLEATVKNAMPAWFRGLAYGAATEYRERELKAFTESERERIEQGEELTTEQARELYREKLGITASLGRAMRVDYEPRAIIGEVPEELLEGTMRVMARRLVRGPYFATLFHRELSTGKDIAGVVGQQSFRRKRPELESVVRKLTDEFMLGIEDVRSTVKEATIGLPEDVLQADWDQLDSLVPQMRESFKQFVQEEVDSVIKSWTRMQQLGSSAREGTLRESRLPVRTTPR